MSDFISLQLIININNRVSIKHQTCSTLHAHVVFFVTADSNTAPSRVSRLSFTNQCMVSMQGMGIQPLLLALVSRF